MNNFTFYSPTYFVFGRDEENNAGHYIKRFAPQIPFVAVHLYFGARGL